ncbi:hypothetical protein [Hyphomonas sp.]|uniref:hypothetical protein n=1 Tax=Hyphomonas sp. TaxID=87 RepID=UPI0035621FE3
MKTLFISTLLAFATCAAFAQSPDLTLARDEKRSRAAELPQIPVHFTLDKPSVVTLVWMTRMANGCAT